MSKIKSVHGWLKFVALGVVLLLAALAGCGGQAPSPGTGQPEAPATGQPVKGGTLRIIMPQGPQVLGYLPEMGPNDEAAVFPAVERMMDYTSNRTLEPFLAESVTEDPDKLTITFKLRPGIKFHDGTELTAEVAAWNYQLYKDAGRLQFGSYVKSIEVVDKYTMVIHLTHWNNQMIHGLGWVPIYSKEAYEKNGGKEWARFNIVATGPFKLEKFERDVGLTWVKNEDYWQEGMPYVDRIEVKIVPDAATAMAMMEAGEADIWNNVEPREQAEMEKRGFVRQAGWAGLQWHLMPNTVSPDSKWKDKRLREALEYAVDKEALAKAIGYGYGIPLNTVAPPGEWGGDLPLIRPYDPEKAKQLLAEAGYPNGLKVKLLAVAGTGGRNEGAEAIKGYLDAAGFQTEIDVADPGRFYGSVWGNGWEDLVLMFSGNDVTYLVSAQSWWSHEPKANLASFHRPPELVALFDEALKMRTEEEQKAATEKIVQYMRDEALIIPLYHIPVAIITKPYVHTTYLSQGLVSWDFHDLWMDKH